MKRLSIRRRFVRIPVPTVSFTKIHKENIKKRLIILSLDGTIYLKDIEGNDWTDRDISSHDLATIANTIDNTIKESQRNTAS